MNCTISALAEELYEFLLTNTEGYSDENILKAIFKSNDDLLPDALLELVRSDRIIFEWRGYADDQVLFFMAFKYKTGELQIKTIA